MFDRLAGTTVDVLGIVMAWAGAVILFLMDPERPAIDLESNAEQDRFDEVATRVEELLVHQKRRQHSILSLGVIGSGRSSMLNSLVNFPEGRLKVKGGELSNAFVYSSYLTVSLGQIQCTWGYDVISNCVFKGRPSNESFKVVDGQGLPRDRNISASELEHHLRMQLQCLEELSYPRVFVTLDLGNRSNLASISNLLILCKVLNSIRSSCCLCVTRWNMNSIDWNQDLLKWCRKYRKQQNSFLDPPPTPDKMLHDLINFLQDKMGQDESQLNQILEFIEFFPVILWPFSLDQIELEDFDNNELPDHLLYLNKYYNDQVVKQLCENDPVITVSDFPHSKKQLNHLILDVFPC